MFWRLLGHIQHGSGCLLSISSLLSFLRHHVTVGLLNFIIAKGVHRSIMSIMSCCHEYQSNVFRFTCLPVSAWIEFPHYL